MMGWNLVRVSDLPLNSRILRYGCHGRDVVELQELLGLAGFYFGEKDGWFGLLTEEAVDLLQKTYDLKVDGIAGKEVIQVLKKTARKTGRLIYTIKKIENLNSISQKYGVGKTAWRRIPGQGNPHTKVYQGMKVLLHQKVFFYWDNKLNSSSEIIATGYIKDDIKIKPDGNLVCDFGESPDLNALHLIGATGDVWAELLSSPKVWKKLVQELKTQRITILKYGIDFRYAPVDKIVSWLRLLKYLLKNVKQNEFFFIVLPFFPRGKGYERRMYWLNLLELSVLARLIMLEPVFKLESPEQFTLSAKQIVNDLRQIVKLGFNNKTLLIYGADAWDWNLNQGSVETVTYKEAKIIRAQNYRKARYYSDSKVTVLEYFRRNEPHSLIYRDQTGWIESLEMIIKTNLLGVVIRNFNVLGKQGPELITNSFLVIPNIS